MGQIVVTGIGIITALGNNLSANRKSLLAHETGVSRAEFVGSKYADLKYFGEIKHNTEALKKQFDILDAGVTRTSLLSLSAFCEAVENANLSAVDLASEKTALVSANTVGGMCQTNDMYADANNISVDSPYLSSYDNGASTIFLQDKFDMRGHANTINTACSSSANAIMYGARLIKNGLAKRAIVGGVDSLSKFTINGFNALHILSDSPCRPFDHNRSGLNLGEGAAYLVLEDAKDIGDKKVYARFSGYQNSNDAFHSSALSDEGVGPFLAMEGALKKASLMPADISYINAHGTGTGNNDLSESNAMMRLFGKIPPFSSTKSFTGHTLGAAGAIEAVFSILAIQNQEIYPSLHFATPMLETRLTPILEAKKQVVKHVMSNSFGFGGNCSSLIFSAP